jgi:hypothetical protein
MRADGSLAETAAVQRDVPLDKRRRSAEDP